MPADCTAIWAPLSAVPADLLFTIGSAAEQIARGGQRRGGCRAERIRVFPADGHEAAAQALREIVRPGDSLLFKASNRMNLKKVIERMGIS